MGVEEQLYLWKQKYEREVEINKELRLKIAHLERVILYKERKISWWEI